MRCVLEEMETPYGEIKISRIAKANDFTKNNPIKDEQREVLRDLDRIMGIWKGYFDKLLNGENHRMHGLTQGISRNEVKITLSQMKKGETTEMDGIPEYV